MKKRLLLVGILLMLLTGCTPIKNNSSNYNALLTSILSYNNKSVNKAAVGYEYYLPKGLKVIKNKDYNQTFEYSHNYLYLYVDIVSYYYKNNLNLSDNSNDHYYYSKLNDKGYILIDKEEENNYFFKIVYNYAKIEAYSTSENLEQLLSYSMIVLNSINYNDLTIESILNNNNVSSRSMNYEVKGPNSNGKFSEYLEEYVDKEEENVLPDE